MLADPYFVPPFTTPVDATVRLPGSKSITNRAMLLAALGGGETTITGALFSEDTAIMADGLRRLGFFVSENAAAAEIRVQGRRGEIPVESAELFVGLAGTAARFLTALCCLAPRGKFKIDGVPQMRRRPVKGLLDALEKLGARITSDHGFFPIEIEAGGLRGGEVLLDATESSQLLSALLMVAPLANGAVIVRLTDPGYRREYVTMTLEMMEQFGQPAAAMSSDGLVVRPPWRAHYHRASGVYAVEPDASAASYFLALPLIVGGTVRLPGFATGAKSLQGDAAFVVRVTRAGAIVEETADGIACRFDASSRPAAAIDDNFHAISDTFLTMAAIAPLLRGTTRISGIAHTRKQETDRVAGMARELTKLGQTVVETDDALEIHPQPLKSGVEIETYGDHRFAMSFGVLGCHDLHGDGRPWLAIKNPACCAKTFPAFFETLEAAPPSMAMMRRGEGMIIDPANLKSRRARFRRAASFWRHGKGGGRAWGAVGRRRVYQARPETAGHHAARN
jgi:3-phosphoshikimate 1-carboxyvinyltransferase